MQTMKTLNYLFTLLLLCTSANSASIENIENLERKNTKQKIASLKTNTFVFKTKQVRIKLRPRSPEQIAAFYFGRGFPLAMVNEIKQLCFITVSLHNRSKHKLLLDFTNWYFNSKTNALKRYTNSYWIKIWKKHKYPKPSIATFTWTTLKDQFEFQPDEYEAGNIILKRSSDLINIKGTLFLLKNNKPVPIKINFEGIRCVQNKTLPKI